MFWKAVQDALAAVWTCLRMLAHLFSFRFPNRGDGSGGGDIEQPLPPAIAPSSSSPERTGLRCLLQPQPHLSAATGLVDLKAKSVETAVEDRGPHTAPVETGQRRRSAPIDIPRRPRADDDHGEYYRPLRWNQPDFQSRYRKFLYMRYYYRCMDFHERFPMRYMPTRTQSWPGCLKGAARRGGAEPHRSDGAGASAPS